MKKASTDKTIRRRGGRPPQAQAARLREKILDAAAAVFFAEGYGATTIEAIAKRARMAKRTLYTRFRGKPDLFAAVVHHIVEGLRPADTEALFKGSGPEILEQLANVILEAALKPQALALHRIILAEATRFPELAAVLRGGGARDEAVHRIAGLLEHEVMLTHLKIDDPIFAAEQFLQMVVSAPQRRALGLGTPLTKPELADWARKTVKLFLNGCKG